MRVMSLTLTLAGALALAGCKDTDRPLSYTKGEYGGKADTSLNAEQIEILRQRSKSSYQ